MIPWTWFLNPKNMILVALACVLTLGAGYILMQKIELTKNKASIETLTQRNLVLDVQVEAYKKNIEDIKALKQRERIIEKKTATIREIVKEVPVDRPVGGVDCGTPQDKDALEKIRKAVVATTDYFNSGIRMQQLPGSSTVDSKVLSSPVEAGPKSTIDGATVH